MLEPVNQFGIMFFVSRRIFKAIAFVRNIDTNSQSTVTSAVLVVKNTSHNLLE